MADKPEETATVDKAAESAVKNETEEKPAEPAAAAEKSTADAPAAKAAEPLTAEQKAGLLKQIEFYFSDSNMPNDKFLKAEAEKNKEGFVQIEVLTRFNLVKKFSTDVPAIADALSTSTALVISDDKTMIRRKDPLPTDDPTLTRSVHVSGLPKDVRWEAVKEFFTKEVGEVNMARLRREGAEKELRGNCWVEFANDELAGKAAAKDKVEFEGTTITIKLKCARRLRRLLTSTQIRLAGGEQRGEVEEEGGPAGEGGGQEEEGA